MSKIHNIFISHHGKDDKYVQLLKKRLKSKGYKIRNSSIDSTKYEKKRPRDRVIARKLRIRINWSKTFICLIGEKTHSRKWVNYEIKKAHLKNKTIIGIYKHGCNNSVIIPEALKKYGESIIGWNSIKELGKIISGEKVIIENPQGEDRKPIYKITRVKC